MRRTIIVAATAAGLVCGLAPVGAAEPAAPAGRVVYEDDFSRTDLGGRWKIHPNSYTIRDGVLVGAEQPGTTHGAVSQIAVDVKDAVVEFDFRFEGSPRFNVVFNDHAYKGSHAGHICRVAVTPKALTLGDDKEGQYKNEIYKLRMDPKTKDQAEPLLKGRSARAAVDLERAGGTACRWRSSATRCGWRSTASRWRR